MGERGRRREILVPMREGETIDKDGTVVEVEHRVGGGRTSWRRPRGSAQPKSSVNTTPIGQRRTQQSRAEGNSLLGMEKRATRSTSPSVSELVKKVESRLTTQEREQEQQEEFVWEPVSLGRGFKSKRGDRSMSASPVLEKKKVRQGDAMRGPGQL